MPNTIAQLKQAGMKVWILTGDKQETAVNIGCAGSVRQADWLIVCSKSCSLIDNLDLQFISTGYDLCLTSTISA